MNPGRSDLLKTFDFVPGRPFDLWVRKEYREDLLRQGIAAPAELARNPGAGARFLRGRGRPVAIPIAGKPGESMVLRECLHGGLSGPVFGGLFFGRSRAVEEAVLAEHARASGVPTYLPLAVATMRVFLLFYRAWLVSLEIPGGRDLFEYLSTSPQPAARGRAIETAGRAVRKMHDAGILHADLNLKNLCVTTAGDTADVFILDWDKSALHARVTERQRFGNLERLDRSAAKLMRKGLRVSLRDRVRFLRAYLAGSAMFDARRFGGMRPGRLFHAVFWRLGDLLGGTG